MSATLLQSANGFARDGAMPIERQPRAYYTETKYECIRMLRTPGFSIPFLGIPALLYILFGVGFLATQRERIRTLRDIFSPHSPL
jgi:hypothetical protein